MGVIAEAHGWIPKRGGFAKASADLHGPPITAGQAQSRLERITMPTTQQREQPKNGDAIRSPDVRPKPDGATPMLSEEMRRPINRAVTPDLRSHCPVCGNPYQPGERVLALDCLALAPGAVPSSPATAGCGPGWQITLGHYRCVLPRLLTLLAGFQPELRFVRALDNFSAGESIFSERHHDEI